MLTLKEVISMKRAIDLICSIILIIFFSPLMMIISISILISMGSPILFKQERPGLHGKPFYIYKFRTMIEKRDSSGKMLPGKERLTKTGVFLRKFSLDEPPRLYNVFRGELSLVGPRPLLMEYLALYTEEQARRHEVKPGITGWAQVNGRNAISWEEKFKYDLWYVDNQSTWVDIKIIFLTVKKVVIKEGVSSKAHYSMDRYRGAE